MRSLYLHTCLYFLSLLFVLFCPLPAVGQPSPEVEEAYKMLEQAEGLIQDEAFEEAVFLCQDAEQLFIALEGDNSPGVADALILLGEAHRHQRKLNQSIQFFNRALEIRLTFLPETHADIDFCYTRLGNIFEDKGNYDQAIAFYLKALEVRMVVYGEPHLKVVSIYRMLGAAYYAKGDFDRAFSLFEKGFLMQTQLPEDPACFQMRMLINMGASLTSKGDFDQAELYFHKALALRSNYPPSPRVNASKPQHFRSVVI